MRLVVPASYLEQGPLAAPQSELLDHLLVKKESANFRFGHLRSDLGDRRGRDFHATSPTRQRVLTAWTASAPRRAHGAEAAAASDPQRCSCFDSLLTAACLYQARHPADFSEQADLCSSRQTEQSLASYPTATCSKAEYHPCLPFLDLVEQPRAFRISCSSCPLFVKAMPPKAVCSQLRRQPEQRQAGRGAKKGLTEVSAERATAIRTLTASECSRAESPCQQRSATLVPSQSPRVTSAKPESRTPSK